MGLGRGGVVLSIAAELRILYFLERVYAIPRANRFLRVRRSTAVPIHFDLPRDDWGGGTATSEFQPEDSQYRSFEDTTGRFPPAPPDDEDTADQTTAARWSFDAAALEPFEPADDFYIEETPIEHILEPPPPGHPRRPFRQPEELPEPPPVEVAPAHAPAPLGGEELRRFVETIAEAPAPAALGRVALRRVAVKPSSGEVVEAAAVASVFAAGATIEDIARAIRRGQTRNRVGDLAIGALRRFGDGLEAAVLFVLREDVAIGWKGYACGDEAAVDELAIPLDTPSVLAAAARERRALLIDGSHGSELDHRLAAALGRPEPGQIAVAPVILAEHPVALLYGQAARMTAHAELFAAVTSAITSAFARLLKAAQR
jgi:hypothetical protein